MHETQAKHLAANFLKNAPRHRALCKTICHALSVWRDARVAQGSDALPQMSGQSTVLILLGLWRSDRSGTATGLC